MNAWALATSLDEQLADPRLSSWSGALHKWRSTHEAQRLVEKVDNLAHTTTVYPSQVFEALAECPAERVKVVILGQDPYHGPGQAHGLAFSVQPGVKPPPSLRNIFKELRRSTGIDRGDAGCLVGWARQGVLLLNTALTVESGRAASHSKLGWLSLTRLLVDELAADPAFKVFLLWGNDARKALTWIEGAEEGSSANAGDHRLILSSNHPSPLSASRPPEPFLGNNHFAMVNKALLERGLVQVDWSL